jgi:hypothetical protein
VLLDRLPKAQCAYLTLKLQNSRHCND